MALDKDGFNVQNITQSEPTFASTAHNFIDRHVKCKLSLSFALGKLLDDILSISKKGVVVVGQCVNVWRHLSVCQKGPHGIAPLALFGMLGLCQDMACHFTLCLYFYWVLCLFWRWCPIHFERLSLLSQ